MKKRNFRSLLVLLLTFVLVITSTGCGKKAAQESAAPQEPEKTLAELLYENRITVTDENTPKSQLFQVLGLQHYVGEYTVSLDDSTTPATVVLSVAKRPDSDSAIQAAATILLALIADAQNIQWNFPMEDDNPNITMGATFTLDNAIYKMDGEDIKSYGTSVDQVQAMLDHLGYE